MTQIVVGAIIALFSAALGYGVKKPNTKVLNDRVSRLESNVEFVARSLAETKSQIHSRPAPAPVYPPVSAGNMAAYPPQVVEPEWVKAARQQIQRVPSPNDQMAVALQQMAEIARAEGRL